MIAHALAALPLLIWLYLLLARGGFWRLSTPLAPAAPEHDLAAKVVVIIPARDEAAVVGDTIRSLLQQNYGGAIQVILVDDASADGTAHVASEAAASIGASARLTILTGAPLAPGWTGKLWAMSQGVAAATTSDAPPKYLLLTDADIAHAPDNLRRLVARAEAKSLVLTSLMARLSCANAAERLLIPAFVYFFAMVYPFAKVNTPKSRTAGAAGGVMLARADALAAAGGIAAIRTALIDDCTLGALMKGQGPIWLGLTDRAESIRPYGSVGEIGRMISRSAYAQLNYSPLILIGAVLGMVVTYLAAPLVAIFAPNPWRWAGAAAWLLMALSFQPTLRFYRRSPLWGLALPAIGALYTAFTVQSAIDVWRGRGGAWKGRAQALAGRDP